MVGSKRGSRDFRDGGGEKTERLRETAVREESCIGACLEVRCSMGSLWWWERGLEGWEMEVVVLRSLERRSERGSEQENEGSGSEEGCFRLRGLVVWGLSDSWAFARAPKEIS